MREYDTPYDLAADQYANGDYDTYVGEVTAPDGGVHDVEVHPSKRDTVIVTGPNGRGREVDAADSKHRQGESLESAYLRIATEHLRETRMTSFNDLYPTPDHESATALQVAGHRAAHVLYLVGRADKREELHGRDDTTYLALLSLAGAEAQTAQALWAHFAEVTPDRSARYLLTAAMTGEVVEEGAYGIAARAGYDPDKARTAGYES